MEGGGSPYNYTVVLLGMGGQMAHGEWNAISSECVDSDYGDARDVVLTDDDGYFNLSVWTRHPPDSLAVAVVEPDLLTLGDVSVRRSMESSPIEEMSTGPDDDSGGCEDGGVTTRSYVVAHRYETVKDLVVFVTR